MRRLTIFICMVLIMCAGLFANAPNQCTVSDNQSAFSPLQPSNVMTVDNACAYVLVTSPEQVLTEASYPFATNSANLSCTSPTTLPVSNTGYL